MPLQSLGDDMQDPLPISEAGEALTTRRSWVRHEPPVIDGYRLIDLLGEGGMGTVWRAQQLSTGRQVAIKFLAGAPFGSTRMRARFIREVELTAKLNHPHIAHVYDSGLERGAHYYVMQLVAGQPLHEYVARKALGRDDILSLMITVCRAVEYAHQRGIIHRDLKPGNVLVDEDRQPHVMDFGLAACEDDAPAGLHLTQGVMGTVAYMAPEQAAGDHDRITTRCDVYALGIMLHQLVTGAMPMDMNQSRGALLAAIAEGRLTPPRRVQPTIDRGLEAILLKATAHDPSLRYAHAGDLAEDLHNFLHGEPLRARPLTLPSFLLQRARKHRGRLMLAAVVAAVLSAGGLWTGKHVQSLHRSSEQNAQQAGRTEYQNLIAAAQRALDHHDAAGALAALDRCNPALRDVEWSLLRRWSDRSFSTFVTDGPGIRSLTFDEGGDRLLTLTARHELIAWDPRTGSELSRTAVTATPQESGVIVVAGRGRPDRSAAAPWRMESGENGAVLCGMEGVRALAISADGSRMAWLDAAGQVEVLRLKQDVPARVLEGGDAAGLCLSDDGGLLAIVGDDLRVYSVEDGAAAMTYESDGPLSAAVFGADAGLLAAGGVDGGIALVDVRSGRRFRFLAGHEGRITALRFDRGSKRLISAAQDRTVRVWDVESGRLIDTLHGHGSPIQKLALHPTGELIASAGADGVIKLWQLPQAEGDVLVKSTNDPLTTFALSDDGRWLAGGRYHEIDVFDLRHDPPSKQTLSGHLGLVTAMALSPDGKTLISADETARVMVWDVTTGLMRRELAGLRGAAYGLTFTPDGEQVAGATLYGDRQLLVWEVGTGRMVTELHAFAPIAWSPDGGLLAGAALDRGSGRFGYQLWNTQTWQPTMTRLEHNADVTHLAFEPLAGAHLAAADRDGMVRIVDRDTGGLLAAFSPHPGRALWGGLRYSATGRRLITAGPTVDVWDAGSGMRLLTLVGESQGPHLFAAESVAHHSLLTAGPLQVHRWRICTDSRPR